jgi:hypothetical protein
VNARHMNIQGSVGHRAIAVRPGPLLAISRA